MKNEDNLENKFLDYNFESDVFGSWEIDNYSIYKICNNSTKPCIHSVYDKYTGSFTNMDSRKIYKIYKNSNPSNIPFHFKEYDKPIYRCFIL
jgi:hypothetical protein